MALSNEHRTVLSVSDLNSEVALMLSRSFGVLWLEGEISNFSRPASGHFYFSLKDNKAQVRCAMFRNRNLALKIKPANGMLVRVRATTSSNDEHITAFIKVSSYYGRLDLFFCELPLHGNRIYIYGYLWSPPA